MKLSFLLALGLGAFCFSLPAQAQLAKFTPLPVLVPESAGKSPADKGVRYHTRLRVLAAANAPVFNTVQFNTPVTLRTLYRLPSTGGSGAIAIVDAYHYPTALQDFNTFAQQFGLPVETSTNVLAINPHLQVVYATGVKPLSGGNFIAGWNLEAALDIEWAHAMAPNAKIYLVEAANDSTNALDYAVQVASNLPNVREVSMSWGGSETANESYSYDPLFTKSGIVYLAAGGDSSDSVEYPSASPNVISCGGTSVNRNSTGVFVSETAWKDSGCGRSLYEKRPAFQNAIASIIGSQRGVTDVSYDSDPNTGVYVYDSTPEWGESGWTILGGTSLATPALAGVFNLAASSGNGFAVNSAAEEGRLYGNLNNPNAFRDIVSGTDGNLHAALGWDYITGVGSPVGLVGK